MQRRLMMNRAIEPFPRHDRSIVDAHASACDRPAVLGGEGMLSRPTGLKQEHASAMLTLPRFLRLDYVDRFSAAAWRFRSRDANLTI